MIWRPLIRHFFTLALVLVSSLSWGQTKKDSLLRVLHQSGFSDSLCNDLLWVYVFNKPDSGIYFGMHGLNWAHEHKSTRHIASLYNRVGVAYDIKSMPDSALFWYDLAYNRSHKDNNPKVEAGVLNNIGLIYWNLGQTEKAIDHYIRAADIFTRLNDQMGLGNTYNNIGLVLEEEGQVEKSMQYYRKALKIRLQTNHRIGIAATCLNMAWLFSRNNMHNPDSAIFYLQKAIPLYAEMNDRYGLSRAYNGLSDYYTALEQFEAALEARRKALVIQQELGNTEGAASTYYNMANIYRLMGDGQMELAYLDTAEMVTRANNDLALLWKVYRTKARSYGRMGKYKEAYPYWILFEDLKDSLITEERSRQIEELETRYRTAQQQQELMEKKADLAEVRLKVEHRTTWITWLVGAIIVLLLVGLIFFESYRRKKQAEKDAAIIEERERGLSAIIEATEEERKRIARDLHDGIVQTLTAVSLRLQKGFSMIRNASAEQQTRYDESKAMLDNSIAELRNISHQMMPRALAEMGLLPAMDDMLAQSLGDTGIHYEFEHHRMEGQRFVESVEISVYRIAQELVNNIIKHSKAKAVSVQLLRTNTHLVLVIEDNGIGFKFGQAHLRNGIGLMNINSRAKAIHGEVSYQPSPDQGTVATIRIPIP